MKIQYSFARGHASEIQTARDRNDFEGWVQRKFATKIRELISDDFTLDVQPDCFIAEFTYEDDARAFLRTIGGIEIG